MPKRVRMLAEIINDRCTGCRLCEQVCPTVAIHMRERQPDEPGPGKRIAVMHDPSCYNAQACLEVCPENAIVMRELPEPFAVGIDLEKISLQEQRQIKELCQKAGYPPYLEICMCTTTHAAEIAAAVIRGATTPDEISLATGARTGCLELCLQPLLDFLEAHGIETIERHPKNGFQWYGKAATLKDHLTPEMQHLAQKPLPSREDNPLSATMTVAIGSPLMSGKLKPLSWLRRKILPEAINADIQKQFTHYPVEQDMHNMLRYFFMANVNADRSNTKTINSHEEPVR